MHFPEFGVRRQAQRDAALDFYPEMLLMPSKAPSKPAHSKFSRLPRHNH
jgi:hypothetical protein